MNNSLQTASGHFGVVLGLSPAGLSIARELGRAGIRVAGVAEGPQCGAYSRYITERPVINAHTGKRDLVTALNELANRTAGRGVLIPTSDQMVEFVSRHSSALSRRFDLTPLLRSGDAANWLDKSWLLKTCRRLKIDVPETYVCDGADVREYTKTMSYPFIIKPAKIHRVKHRMAGKKVILVRTPDELEKCLNQLPVGETQWLVQDIIPGPESDITLYAAYYAQIGRPTQVFTARKLRQYVPAFGSASLAVSETLNETEALAGQLFSQTHFRGFCTCEFKRDPRDDKLKLIEVNPRPALWHELTVTSGKHLATAAYQDLTGAPLPADQPQIDGVVWRYLWKDLYAQAYYAINRNNSVLPKPKTHFQQSGDGVKRSAPVFMWTDLRPSFAEGAGYARKFIQRSWSGSTNRRPQ